MSKTPKPWAIFVWIAGDNNLSEFGRADIDELKQVGSTDRLDIVVQYDCSGTDGTRRYHLHRGTTLEKDLVLDLGETNTGDPEVAIDFFTWAMENYPSQRVVCVLWNHGSGIDEAAIYGRVLRDRGEPAGRKPHVSKAARGQARAIVGSKLSRALFSTTIDAALASKAIAFDDTSRDFLDNLELAQVISTVSQRAGRVIDVLGFDACLMSMVEVAYQLQGLASFLVGSEETEPGAGWPYELVAAAATTAQAPSARKLASSIVTAMVASYADNPDENMVTQSALDLRKIEGFVAAIDELAVACLDNLQSAEDYAAFSKAISSALRFTMRDFVDLGDLCAQLAARSSSKDVVKAAKHVLSLLTGSGGLVARRAYKGKAVKAATGVAIYFPLAGDVTVAYDRLDFARDTRWPALIAKYRSA